MSLHRETTLLAASLLLVACGPPQQIPTPSPDRVTTVLPDGTVWRQTTSDENSDFTATASADALWSALTGSYTALGILPSLNDRPGLRYGNAGFIMPNRLGEHRIGEYFDCGQGPTGARAESGRLYASVMSAIAPAGAGRLRVQTRISATWRSNEGASGMPVTCGSTGLLETALRAGVEQRLSPQR